MRRRPNEMWVLTLWRETLDLWRCLGQRAHLRASEGSCGVRDQTNREKSSHYIRRRCLHGPSLNNTEGYDPVQWRWWLSSGSVPFEASAWCWAAASCTSHTSYCKYRRQTHDTSPEHIATCLRDELPAEGRSCDFLCEGQVLFGGDKADTVPSVTKKD